MNFKLCMALAILSFSAYAARDGEGSAGGDDNEADSCADFGMVWDGEGGCIEGRHLRDVEGSPERDYTEVVVCANIGMMWDADEGACIDGDRRLRGDEEGVEEKPEGDDCTEEDGCEGHRRLEKWSDRENKENTIPEESEDDGNRRLANGSTDGGKCRRKGKRCLDDEEFGEEDDYEREEDHGDLVYDGERRLSDG